MKGSELFDRMGMSTAEFASWLGISGPSAWRYRHDQRPIPLEVALKVERLTAGTISAEDLVPALANRKKKK